MRIIREVDEKELDEFARITVEAFPGLKIDTPEARRRMLEQLSKVLKEPIVHFFGVFDEGQMVGVMRCYDFTMKLHDGRVAVGGLGGVAVDLRHKKEHVAADMVRHYLDNYRAKGAALAALYPFRPDFYRRMGFGYGVKLNRYKFSPEALPADGLASDALPAKGLAERVDYLSAADRDDVAACYDRFLERTNGLLELPPHVLNGLFSDPAVHLVGYWAGGQLRGYLIFRFEAVPDGNWLLNDLQVRALVYDDAAALAALLGFLRKQADQVGRIIYETQDEAFHHLLNDPRDGSGNLLAGLWHQTNTQGLGIMYRVIDVARLWAVLGDHDFGGVTTRLRLNLSDTFLPENAGIYRIDFNAGRATPAAADSPADVAVNMDVSDFSSLIVGAVDFDRLHAYGRVTLSDDAHVPLLTRLFRAKARPWCMTHF
ncbi:putative GCN5-like N-acetyltransferase [Candidatus Promineifilum breve]|uniref:GCN5-like N-acetyltransferase n=1 Tax=Candidatus Promineifilum breve TaxID=1806508 RepID=A0A160T7U7_9CHLR|nr:GNAT family N-acetyltransferase [Candidatus Promineifilum breve]CUS04970.2 putative GCN5-like N-acetyltransferase [Candidatus Promineifilum breve]